jgi:hypothetical protein
VRTAITTICLIVALALTTAAASARLPNDVVTPANPTAATAPQQPVIHELHTVVRERDAGRTLALVLAGSALLIACGSAAFSVTHRAPRRAT